LQLWLRGSCLRELTRPYMPLVAAQGLKRKACQNDEPQEGCKRPRSDDGSSVGTASLPDNAREWEHAREDEDLGFLLRRVDAQGCSADETGESHLWDPLLEDPSLLEGWDAENWDAVKLSLNVEQLWADTRQSVAHWNTPYTSPFLPMAHIKRIMREDACFTRGGSAPTLLS